MFCNTFYKESGIKKEEIVNNAFVLDEIRLADYLTKIEKECFKYRYVEGLSYRNIGEKYRKTHEWARQKCKDLIFKLKTPKNISYFSQNNFNKKTIDFLNISKCTYKKLENLKIKTIKEASMMMIQRKYPKHFGKKCLEELSSALLEVQLYE